MFEFACTDLKAGDEFTIDEGQSWHIARNIAVRPNIPNTVVVIETDDETFELDPHETVIVK